jgi:signal transduction histidine kinase
MNVEPVDPTTIFDRCVRLVRHQLELTGIQLHLELDNDLPRVQCDAAQIEQVLLALIMNAIDAMPRGGNLWLRARVLETSQEMEMQVRDDGMGIPPEILPQIFEPFLTTKESGHGVGLGLAISRSIIDRHGGHIEVQSEAAKGTTFTLRLPLHAEAPVAAASGLIATQNTR